MTIRLSQHGNYKHGDTASKLLIMVGFRRWTYGNVSYIVDFQYVHMCSFYMPVIFQ